MKKNLLILTALWISFIGYSQTFTDANFIEYTVIPSTNTVQVTDYDYANGGVAVNIPSTVDYNSATYDVTEIGDEAFLAYGSTEKITSVIIPNSITFIGYRAFQGNLLTSVTIPDSVTQLSNLSFGENPQLTNVILSNNLTTIAQFSFVSCGLTSINIPSSVTTIGSNAFAVNQLTSVTIPSNVSVIELRAFINNPLNSVISEGVTPATVVTPSGGNTSSDSFSTNRSTIDLLIPNGTSSAYASAQWTGFNSVTETGGLAVGDTFIENYITYEVTSLVPDTVSVIDYDMAGGTVVDIPATVPNTSYSVTEIGFEAFNDKGIMSVSIPISISNIGNRAFRNNLLSTVTIPDSVTIINDETFVNNQLTNVVLGTNVTSIEFAAFQDNNLTTITLPNSLTNIGGQAFYSNLLTSITIPDGVLDIGGSSFYNNNLTSVIIPNSVTTITGNSFRNNQLTNVTLGDNITTIGVDSFSFNNLTSVTIGNNVTSILASAFRNNQLTNIIIPNNVNEINWRAFQNNPLVSVTSESVIPPSVFTGGAADDSFGDRSGVDLIIPTGTTDIYITNPNAGADWSGFNSVTEAAQLAVGDIFIENYITYQVTSLAPETVKAVDYDMAGGTVVNIPSTTSNSGIDFEVTEIGISAFSNNLIEDITIPSSVTSIGDYAFAFNELTSIDIPDTVTSIGDSAFQDNLLTIVELPDGLISIPSNLFRNNQIVNINIPNTVTSIGLTSFYNNQLTSVTIPNNVASIGTYAFQNNPLTDVYSLSTTPPTIATGTDDTFSTNRSIIHLHIPAGTMGAYVTDAGALWTGFNPVTEDALSLSDYELANDVKVITMTNHIKVIASNSLELKNYTLYNIAGAKVANGTESNIYTGIYANGLYILKLDFENGTVVKKVVIN